MSYWKEILQIIGVALLVPVTDAAWAQNEEFDGPLLSCEKYVDSVTAEPSTKAQGELARLWVHGYLTGLYKATGNLEISEAAEADEALREAILSECREYPETTILAVSQRAVAPKRLEIPAEITSNLSIDGYTCGAHLDAREEDDEDHAELAEWWAFAFIQGYKNAEQPEMVIEMKNKALLVDAINANCANDREVTYLDLTTMVARAVKLE